MLTSESRRVGNRGRNATLRGEVHDVTAVARGVSERVGVENVGLDDLVVTGSLGIFATARAEVVVAPGGVAELR